MNGQVNLSLHWAHIHFVGFVMRWLIYLSGAELKMDWMHLVDFSLFYTRKIAFETSGLLFYTTIPF